MLAKLEVKKNAWIILMLVIIWLLANFFCWQFLRQENYIYFWDWSFYHSRFEEFTALLKHNPLNALDTLIYSIRHSEYSLIAPSLLSPFGLLFGTSRVAYVLLILNLFTLPAVYFMAWLFSKNFQAKKIAFLVFVTITLFLPNFWIPVLTGYYDALGLLLISFLYFFYFKRSFLEQTTANFLIIATILVLLVLTRRWYGYFVAGFFPAIFLTEILLGKEKNPKKILAIIKKNFFLGFLFLIVFLSVAKPIFLQLFKTNYYEIYSGYRLNSPFLLSLYQAFSNYGPALLLTAALGLYYCLKNPRLKKPALILLFQSLVSMALFARVQFFDRHHHYLFLPAILFFLAAFAMFLFSKLSNSKQKAILSFFGLAFLSTNFATAFLNFQAKPNFLFGKARHLPLNRTDLPEIQNLLNFLQNLPTGQIYVLSSSMDFNSDILKNACELKSNRRFSVCKNVLQTYDIDKRDGFPWHFLNADYIVTANPPQYHINPAGQKLIGQLSEEITSAQGIGKAFYKLNANFTLQKNIQISIYQKYQPIPYPELEKLLEKFKQAYPNHAALFTRKN